MARAGLRLGVRDLARLANVSAMTVTRIENEHSSGYAETLRKIQRALEVQGAEFINDDCVRLRKSIPPSPKKKSR